MAAEQPNTLPTRRYYPGQFATCPDLLFVAIPQQEILSVMAQEGDHTTLNAVCLSVALVADAVAIAQADA